MWIHPEEHKTVGEILAEARKRAGLTQIDLAKLLKKPQSFVSSYEGGQRRIDILELIRISHAMQADPTALFLDICAKYISL